MRYINAPNQSRLHPNKVMLIGKIGTYLCLHKYPRTTIDALAKYIGNVKRNAFTISPSIEAMHI